MQIFVHEHLNLIYNTYNYVGSKLLIGNLLNNQ